MKLDPLVIRKVSAFFSKKPEIEAVYLFGSQSNASAKKDSDIDIALLVGKKASFGGFDTPQGRYSQDLRKVLGKAVDIVDLSNASVDFAYRVVREGQVLKGVGSRKRIEFEEKVLRVYFDMKPFFDEYAKSIHEIARKGELDVRYL